MIFVKSDYSTQPLLYIPRVAYGEIVSREYPQAIVRDMTAKNPIRALETVTFTIEALQPDNAVFLKKFLNETTGCPVQLDFVPHLIRFKGVFTEVTFEAGRLLEPQTIIEEEGEPPKIVFGGNSGNDPVEITTLVEYNVSMTLIAPEYIELTEQMILNDLEEAGLEPDEVGGSGGGPIWGGRLG